MTRTLPNVPLWPRFGRSGRSAATMSSSSLVASSGKGSSPAGAEPCGGASRRPNPKPTARRSVTGTSILAGRHIGRSQAFEAGQDPPLAFVQSILDVEREDVPAASGPDAEGDGHGIVRFMGDRDRDPAHPELFGTGRGPAVEADRRLAGWQA